MQLDARLIADFQETVWEFYRRHGREGLPWRQPAADGNFDPYLVMVSELMLQQTQVPRVVPKYLEFTAQFPTARALAAAPLGDVLRAWQGLGYNRRAKFLWLAAQEITRIGAFPGALTDLVKLPGVGPNTAGAILAYAYNQPVVFVETNIRTVYIHHFFEHHEVVADAEIAAALTATLDYEHPREFYWALMDYGTHVKATYGNKSRVSKTYARQSAFHGSRRQIRGQVVRLLGGRAYTGAELRGLLPDERLETVLHELKTEGLIREADGRFSLD
jgi:A/G-specific adenine glycosylase